MTALASAAGSAATEGVCNMRLKPSTGAGTIRLVQARSYCPAGSSARLRGGLSFSGALSLLAIASVLLFVSLPRLRGIALQENEVDAQTTAALLARALAGSGGRPDSLGELLSRRELEHALPDADLLSDGRLLRRHGYVFGLVELPPPLLLAGWPAGNALLVPDGPSRRGVFAWPWEAGRTGRAALLATTAARLYSHANRPTRWEGPRAVEALDTWAGWRLARRR